MGSPLLCEVFIAGVSAVGVSGVLDGSYSLG